MIRTRTAPPTPRSMDRRGKIKCCPPDRAFPERARPVLYPPRMTSRDTR